MGLTENVQSIYGAFSDIKDAIEDKGVTVPANTPVTDYAELIEDIPTGGGGVIDAATDYSYIFESNRRINILQNEQLDTAHVTDFNHFANNSTSLHSVAYPLDLSSATNTSYMFYGCTYLTDINISNTSNITNAQNMFNGCGRLFLDQTINLSGATTVGSAFFGVGRFLTPDEYILNIYLAPTLSGQSQIFKESHFTEINILSNTVFSRSIGDMFRANAYLKKITGFNMSNSTTSYTSNTNQPFYGCSALETLELNGTIQAGGINFSTCTSLSAQSIWNILDALAVVTTSKTCTLPSGKMPSASDLTARYGTDFDSTTGKLKGWTLSPTPA